MYNLLLLYKWMDQTVLLTTCCYTIFLFPYTVYWSVFTCCNYLLIHVFLQFLSVYILSIYKLLYSHTTSFTNTTMNLSVNENNQAVITYLYVCLNHHTMISCMGVVHVIIKWVISELWHVIVVCLWVWWFALLCTINIQLNH